MESERLSSSTTFLWKYLYAPFWIVLPTCVVVSLVAGQDPMAWYGLVATLFCIGFAYRKFGKVRQVDLQEDRFYISDLGRRYEVPVSQLQRVDSGSWIHPDTVKMYFKDERDSERELTSSRTGVCGLVCRKTRSSMSWTD